MATPCRKRNVAWSRQVEIAGIRPVFSFLTVRFRTLGPSTPSGVGRPRLACPGHSLIGLVPAVECGVVAAPVEDVDDLHRLAEHPIDDHGAAFERHRAQARAEVVARAPALGRQSDAAAPFADALEVATCDGGAGADPPHGTEDILEIG